MTTTKSTATSKPKTTKPAIAAVPSLPILTAKMADVARTQRDQVRHLELTATRPGTYARVRLVDLHDTTQLLELPADELRRVLEMANAARAYSDRPAELEDGSLDVERAVVLARADAETRDAYVVAGFLEPRLIRGEGDRTSPAQVVVDAIHPADRQAFFELCKGGAPDTGPDTATEARTPAGSGDQVARHSVDAAEWDELTAKAERGAAAAEYVDGLHGAFSGLMTPEQPTDNAEPVDRDSAA